MHCFFKMQIKELVNLKGRRMFIKGLLLWFTLVLFLCKICLLFIAQGKLKDRHTAPDFIKVKEINTEVPNVIIYSPCNRNITHSIRHVLEFIYSKSES